MAHTPQRAPPGLRQRLAALLFDERLPLLFDAGYYRRVNRLSGWAARRPFLHFLLQGRRQQLPHHPLFDVAYYRATHPEADFSRLSPVEHFLASGWQAGDRPNPLFDTRWYQRRYGDVEKAGSNPLLHFRTSGESEGRLPNPLWDPAHLARQLPAGRVLRLQDYLTDPQYWALNPHPLFDAACYRAQAERAGIALDRAPLAHFLAGGWQRFNPHPLFDAGWYLEQYGDVRKSGENPLVHYVLTGEKENRQPHPFFDPHWYRRQLVAHGRRATTWLPAHYLSPEGLAAFPHPLWDQAHVDRQAGKPGVTLLRYLAEPALWAINPHPLFDGAWYRQRAQGRDPLPADMPPVLHFMRRGWKKAIDPHPLFDVDWYVHHFKRIYQTGRNPLAHYIVFAGKSRRRPHALWDQAHVNAQLPPGQPPLVLHEYLQDRRWWDISPHPLFDVAHYRAQAAAAGLVLTISPLEHYARTGSPRDISPQRLFDQAWYRRQYAAELKGNAGTPLTHFVVSGEYSGCNPHPCVDTDWYRKHLFAQGMDDEGKYLAHYLSGAAPQAPIHPLWDQAFVDSQRPAQRVRLPEYLADPAQRDIHPHPLFDPVHYRGQAAAAGLVIHGAPLEHFLREPAAGMVATHVLFDPAWYLKHYEDVAELGRVPLLHYAGKGQYEGRNPHPLWDQAFVDAHYGSEGQRLLPVEYLRNPALQRINPHPLWDQAWMEARHARPVTFLEYLADESRRFLNTHPLFDAGYYRYQVEKTGGRIDRPALRHFLETGWREHHNPHRLFDVAWYLANYDDVVASGFNPLLHYLVPGECLIRDPHPLFDGSWYRQSLEQRGQPLPANLLVHFLTHPGEQAASPHPLWDVEHIRTQTGGQDMPLQQYLKDRMLWAINPHPLFDVAWYQHQVGKTDIAPLLHYVKHPDQLANPSVYFHTEWYVGRNRYLEEFVGKTRIPLVHFLLKGTRQGESPHPYFDSKWYADRFLGADRIGDSPILHYLKTGWRNGLNPNPMFNAAEYRRRHGIPADVDALQWFLKNTPVRLPAVRNRFIDVFVCQPVPARPGGGIADQRPATRYIVLFTPRSGSSLLTDLMASTGLLGRPGEWFNHDLAMRARNTLPGGANTPEEFTRKIQWYRKSANGVFGVQMVWPHLANLIEAGCEPLLVDDDEFIVVHLRQNIVAQAISLYLAAESGYFHSHQAKNKRYLPDYNGEAIANNIDKLLEQEASISQYLAGHPHHRLRLSFYETLAADPAGVITAMGEFIGIDCRGVEVHSPRQKIGGGINADYEARFRAEQAAFLAERLQQRRAVLAGLPAMPDAVFG